MIARKLHKQDHELKELRSALNRERSTKEKNLSELLYTMDSQLIAYRSSVMSERNHQKVMDRRREEEHEDQISALKEKHFKEIHALKSKYERGVSKIKSEYDRLMQAANDKTASIEAKYDKLKQKYNSDIEKLKTKKNGAITKLKKRLKANKEKYKNIIDQVRDEYSISFSALSESVAASSSGDESTEISVIDFESDEDHANKKSAISKDNNADKNVEADLTAENIKNHQQNHQQNHQLLQMQEKSFMAIKEKQEVMEFQVKQKSNQIQHLTSINKENNAEIDKLTKMIEIMRADLQQYVTKIQELCKINDSLRLALGDRDSENIQDLNIKGEKSVLCHTPHFLGFDKDGLKYVKPQISAYNIPGYF